jgi:pimeloyl-ACP methyl ester carboxylesterase
MVAPFADAPSRRVVSADGTPIAVFTAGAGPDLVLVHGTTSDHRTWRVVGPGLAARHTVHAIDRRGRGASGDGPAYAIEREIEDVAVVVDAIAAGRPGSAGTVDLLGHSLGGRIGLAASLRSSHLRRVVAIESAPAAEGATPGRRGRDLLPRLRADLEADDLAGLLARFMTDAVGMSSRELERFRADPVWPLRVAAAPTVVRELEAADGDRAVGRDALCRVRVPVLQLVGSTSPAWFRTDAEALDACLADGRVELIEGAGHGMHHSHAAEVLALVEAFLGGSRGANG